MPDIMVDVFFVLKWMLKVTKGMDRAIERSKLSCIIFLFTIEMKMKTFMDGMFHNFYI